MSGSRTRGESSASRGERFAAVPVRLHEMLRRGELTTLEFAAVCYLVGAADYETREYVCTYRSLADEIRYTSKDDRTLRRAMQRLRALGLVAFETSQGQRDPFVVRVTGADRRRTKEADSVPDFGGTSARPRRDLGKSHPLYAEVDEDAPESAPTFEGLVRPLPEPDPEASRGAAAEVGAEVRHPLEVDGDLDVHPDPDPAPRERRSRGRLDDLPLDVQDALEGLVEEITDGSVDDGTLRSYVAKFYDLPAEAFETAAEKLASARRRGDVIRSEAAWVSGLLSDIAADPRMYGIDW